MLEEIYGPFQPVYTQRKYLIESYKPDIFICDNNISIRQQLQELIDTTE